MCGRRWSCGRKRRRRTPAARFLSPRSCPPCWRCDGTRRMAWRTAHQLHLRESRRRESRQHQKIMDGLRVESARLRAAMGEGVHESSNAGVASAVSSDWFAFSRLPSRVCEPLVRGGRQLGRSARFVGAPEHQSNQYVFEIDGHVIGERHRQGGSASAATGLGAGAARGTDECDPGGGASRCARFGADSVVAVRVPKELLRPVTPSDEGRRYGGSRCIKTNRGVQTAASEAAFRSPVPDKSIVLVPLVWSASTRRVPLYDRASTGLKNTPKRWTAPGAIVPLIDAEKTSAVPPVKLKPE